MRLAVVTNILAPYRVPLFEELAHRCDDFLVLLLAARHANRDWVMPEVGFRTRLLPGACIGRPDAVDPIHINVGAWSALSRFRPDVVLGGGFTPAHVAASLYCRWHDRPYVPWGELTLQHPSESSRVRRWLRRRMIGGGRLCVASSSATRAAFIHYGAESANVLVSPMPVDTARLRAAAAAARESGRVNRLRRQYSAPLVVSAGRLVESKGWPQLLRAFHRLSAELPSASLLIAGDGPQRDEFRALAVTLGIGARVHFLGQLATNDLVEHFSAADVFAFPTLNDPYGAVLAEAMACDALVVSSVHAAATADLIVHEESGFAADPRDEAGFAGALSQALYLPDPERRVMLARARSRLPEDDMQASACAIIEFLSNRMSGVRPAAQAALPGLAGACHRDVT